MQTTCRAYPLMIIGLASAVLSHAEITRTTSALAITALVTWTVLRGRLAFKVEAEAEAHIMPRECTLCHSHVSRIIALKSLTRFDAVSIFQRRALLPPAPASLRARVSFVADVILLRRPILEAVRKAKSMDGAVFSAMDQTYYANTCHGVSKADYFVHAAYAILPAVPLPPTRTNTGYFGPSCTRERVGPTGIERLACIFV